MGELQEMKPKETIEQKAARFASMGRNPKPAATAPANRVIATETQDAPRKSGYLMRLLDQVDRDAAKRRAKHG